MGEAPFAPEGGARMAVGNTRDHRRRATAALRAWLAPLAASAPSLVEAVVRAMSPEPSARWRSADEFSSALRVASASS